MTACHVDTVWQTFHIAYLHSVDLETFNSSKCFLRILFLVGDVTPQKLTDVSGRTNNEQGASSDLKYVLPKRRIILRHSPDRS
jgi:hypothetical protein